MAGQLDGTHLRDLIGAATLAAQAHHSCGAITEARRLARIALARLSLLPGDDLDSLRTQHNLAWFLVILRQPREAEAIYRNVLAARERMLGPDDPESLWTRHELAWLAACEGLWREAETAYREVLDARHRTLGYEHADTLMTRHELAWAIANQGRGAEAEQLLIDVLAARRRVLAKSTREPCGPAMSWPGPSPARGAGPKPRRHTARSSMPAASYSAPVTLTFSRPRKNSLGRSRHRDAAMPPSSCTRRFSMPAR